MQLIVGPILSVIHVCCVIEEMRAAPVNTLNPQRTAMIVADFLKVWYLCLYEHLCIAFALWVKYSLIQTGKVSGPADLRYREDLLFPGRLIEDAGNVNVGRALHKVITPSKLREQKQVFPEEKFLLSHGSKWVDMVLEHNATGEDALRGWLVAAYAADIEKSFHEPRDVALQAAYKKVNEVFAPFVSELQAKGWHTDRFLDGMGIRFAL